MTRAEDIVVDVENRHPSSLPSVSPRGASQLSVRGRRGRSAIPLVLVLIAIVGACTVLIFNRNNETESSTEPQASPQPEWISDLVLAENLILELSPQLEKLNQSSKQLSLPSAAGQSLFADMVAVVDLDGEATETESYKAIKTKSFQYCPGEPQSISRGDLKIWHPLLNDLQELKEARFYFVSGDFAEDKSGQFVTQMGFQGLGRFKTGEWAAIQGKQKVAWSADPAIAKDDIARWKICRWEHVAMKIQVRSQLMFRDIFSDAIATPEQGDLLDSPQDAYISRAVHGEPLELPFSDLEPYFQFDSTSMHPAVSVVDINGDGWDDFYLMTRWSKNRLFVNQKDGTFKNLASDYGLDIDRTSCALFADFDNDGDKDVFLGRSYTNSILMINDDGRFVDRTKENIKQQLPGFVTSVSAADFNNDGKLDLYLSTLVTIGEAVQSVENAANFMPHDEAKLLIYLLRRTSPADIWLERPGPPNRLLVNTGDGTFANSEAIEDVWMNTLQATWCDYDEDGDVDLYLSNDWGPDNLFRNDGEGGFEDVAQQSGGEVMRGYGMGVSWGDFDNDGLQDLYVSNMYSKAGKRIVGMAPDELDPRFMLAATGNRLFKNVDGVKFDLVSGEGEGEVPVTNAGWSWGGQFCDFDNDGFLDLYVASGYYTAPKNVSCDTDL